MKRRNFLKSLGIGATTVVVAPSLLATEIKPITKVPENITKPGQFGQTFKIKLSEDIFQPGDVISTDPEYGQGFRVMANNHPEYSVKLVTNNPMEHVKEESIQKGKEVLKIYSVFDQMPGEYSVPVYTPKFNNDTMLEFDGLNGTFTYHVAYKPVYII
jgi:hypothetical protein